MGTLRSAMSAGPVGSSYLRLSVLAAKVSAPCAAATVVGIGQWSYGSPGLMVKVAEGVGSAPTSVLTDPVFETGAASLYLPAFRKLAARVGLAPTPNGLIPIPNRDYFDTTWQY